MNRYVFLFAFLLLSSFCHAQFEFGVKSGINSTDINTNTIHFNNDETNLEIELEEIQYGLHFGLYTRVKVAGFYIEPSFLLNSSSVTYQLTQLEDDEFLTKVKSEEFVKLDIPLMIGLKFSFLRINLGPVAHINLNSTSELFSISGYEQKFKNATYGYQLGAGIDIWKLRLDMAYEGNFSKFGDHITIDGQDLSFDRSVTRFLLTLGYKF